MAKSTLGPSKEELETISARIGYDLSKFLPRALPGDWLTKLSLSLVTLIVLSFPIAILKFDGMDIGSFALVGLILLLVNLLGGALLQFEIHTICAEWEKSLAGVGNATGEAACKALHQTIYGLRYLLDWRYFLTFTTFPFSVFYVALMALMLVLAFDALKATNKAEILYGQIAMFAFGYYALAFAIRTTILRSILRYTEDLDPSLPLAVALADIHKKFADCSQKR